jgi:hypothetical protein
MGLSKRVRISSPFLLSYTFTWQLFNIVLVFIMLSSQLALLLLFIPCLADEDYVLQFVHPFNRLELLRAQSPCPEAITLHVQQLSGAAD